MIALGVFPGANQACHEPLMSNPGIAASAMVGTSGSPHQRDRPVNAKARILPDWICCRMAVDGAKITWTSPLITALIAGASPL